MGRYSSYCKKKKSESRKRGRAETRRFPSFRVSAIPRFRDSIPSDDPRQFLRLLDPVIAPHRPDLLRIADSPPHAAHGQPRGAGAEDVVPPVADDEAALRAERRERRA